MEHVSRYIFLSPEKKIYQGKMGQHIYIYKAQNLYIPTHTYIHKGTRPFLKGQIFKIATAINKYIKEQHALPLHISITSSLHLVHFLQ